MDVEDIFTAATMFFCCFVIAIAIMLGLNAAAQWFAHLEPAAQVFYGVIFIIAFILSAIITYYFVKRDFLD